MTDLLTHIDFGVGAATGIRTCIRNVRAVTPSGIIDNATVTIQGGVIVEVAERGTPSPGAVDGGGAFLIPGLVDACSDGLAREASPRPDVQLPIDFAVRSFEGRLRAAGITTALHEIRFEDDVRGAHTVGLAASMCDAIEAHQASGNAIVEHRIVARLDASDRRSVAVLARRIDESTRDAGSAATPDFPDPVPLISVEHRRAATTRQTQPSVPALAWLTQAAAAGAIRLMFCEPRNAVDIDDAEECHASIVGFPATIAAATAARDRGLTVLGAAPDVLRGGRQHAVTAADLVAADLCDVLVSDFMPSTLLGAIVGLVGSGSCDLSRAVEMVTSRPAAMLGLRDRGRLVVGLRADLVLVAMSGRLATVRNVWTAEAVPS